MGTSIFVPHRLYSRMLEEVVVEFTTDMRHIERGMYGVNGKLRCRKRWFNGPFPFPME